MENSIEKRLNDLKISFTKITDTKNEDLSTFSILELRMNKLKEIYSEFVNNNKNNLFVFGLDSFRFQAKLIDIEYSDMKRLFLAITNRMYCEYFKLFKIIIEYIKENCDDKKLQDFIKVNDNYPIYKDLEPFKQYDFEIIQNLHELLISLLSSLNNILINKEYDLKLYQSKNNIGLNIDNFVNTFNFNNIMMREKIILFITYLEFFHKLHNKYFKRFTTKLQLMYSQITHDIKFDDNEQSKKTKNIDMLHNLQDEEVGSKILKELRASINDNTESDTGSEFEMFDKLATPKSISVDYEDYQKSDNNIEVCVVEENDVDDVNIKMKITETNSQTIVAIENNSESSTPENTNSREKVTEFVHFPEAPNNFPMNAPSNDDEMSVLTTNSSNEPNEPNDSNDSNDPNESTGTNTSDEKKPDDTPAIKKKRTYKPRKKKTPTN